MRWAEGEETSSKHKQKQKQQVADTDEALHGSMKGEALIPKHTAAMLEGQATPEASSALASLASPLARLASLPWRAPATLQTLPSCCLRFLRCA
jgi:hypothetical protein